jgi:isoquinoline 1-oxidoreductase alpha subunit
MSAITLSVNGARRALEIEPETPLLWVLRDRLGLTGTKFGCGAGLCGACTVHLDGEAVRSCRVAISAAAGKRVTTIEGLARDRLQPLRSAWIAEQVVQCGYCQPGILMSAAALLAAPSPPSAAEVDQALSAHLCRCGTYLRARRAILLAARGAGR